MWLLVFSIMFVLSLQPVFASKSKISQAGQTSGGVAYKFAPQTIIGSGNALFTETGVNTSVILDLLNKVNNASVWSSVTKADGSAVTYQTARNFGEYSADGAANANGNAQILLKLLSDKTFSSEVKTTYNFYDRNNTTINVTGSELTEFTTQYWQVVYRSTSADEDVITLYMNDIFMNEYFDNIGDYYGDYSNSLIRQSLLLTYSTLIDNGFATLDTYVVTPEQLDNTTANALNLGGWQSSSYQTSANSDRSYYNNDSKSGASGYYGSSNGSLSTYYGLENGLDGESLRKVTGTTWGDASYQILDAYDNKLWLPSGFEVLHTGYAAKEGAKMQNTGRNYDENTMISYAPNYTSASSELTNATIADNKGGRTGLWELNGYDRATGSVAWLRSGYSNDYLYAREVYLNGNYDSLYVDDTRGVRPALHLNLKSLASTRLASVSASADASGTTVSASVSTPARSWAETIPAFYNNMFDKNSTSGNGVAKITIDASQYQIGSVKFNETTVDWSDKTAGQTYTLSGICNYSYQMDGTNVVITLNNLQTNVNVVANMLEKITSCTTELQVNFNNVINDNAQIIINVLTGTKDNFSAMQQILVSKKEDIANVVIVLDQGQEYTITVSRPYAWGVSYSGNGSTINEYYVFTPNGTTENHTIIITGAKVPNICVVV